MSALSGEAIRNRLQATSGDRLVIVPILDPTSQLKPADAAIDLRLGRSFTLFRPWSQGVAETLDVGSESGPSPAELPVDPIVLDFGEPLIIHPHQFVLARTLEFVRLPSDLMAYVIGRSSWGRRGLIVATAVVVHPGFAGPITLELKNVGEVPIALYPLDRVAQLALHDVATPAKTPPPASQFSSTFSPTLGNVRDPDTAERIRRMARSR